MLTPTQVLITILAVAAGAAATRFAPFLLFPEQKPQPKLIADLGRLLPPAMMGLLLVYCLRNINVLQAPYGLPELAALAITVGLQLWKRNVLLSIGMGTALYMLLVQFIFVA